MWINYGNLFESWEVKIVKGIVKKYRESRKCLMKDSFEDLVQECLIRWLEVKNKYDPEKGAAIETFMAGVVEKRLRQIVEKYSREKRRDYYYAKSLSVFDEDTGGDIDLTEKLELTETTPAENLLKKELKENIYVLPDALELKENIYVLPDALYNII